MTVARPAPPSTTVAPLPAAVGLIVPEILHVAGGGGGLSVTIAVANCVTSALLVAVTFTICWVEIVEGAAYKPDVVIAPAEGEIDHVTGPPVVVNCWVAEGISVMADGDTVTGVGGGGPELEPTLNQRSTVV